MSTTNKALSTIIKKAMYKITLTGSPVTTNNIYRRNKFTTYMTELGKSTKQDYQREAKSQWGQKPLSGNLKVTINIYFSDRRKRDWDNYHKITMDALNKIVWVDDSQIKVATVIMGYDKKMPRTEIRIEEM